MDSCDFVKDGVSAWTSPRDGYATDACLDCFKTRTTTQTICLFSGVDNGNTKITGYKFTLLDSSKYTLEYIQADSIIEVKKGVFLQDISKIQIDGDYFSFCNEGKDFVTFIVNNKGKRVAFQVIFGSLGKLLQRHKEFEEVYDLYEYLLLLIESTKK
jgi:hypothetical protein